MDPQAAPDESMYAALDTLFQSEPHSRAATRPITADSAAAWHATGAATLAALQARQPESDVAAYRSLYAPGELLGVDVSLDGPLGVPF
jgi:hypothetical protein